jgi:hypothetical protein
MNTCVSIKFLLKRGESEGEGRWREREKGRDEGKGDTEQFHAVIYK